MSKEKQIHYIKASKDNFFIPKKNGDNINFFNNTTPSQNCSDIMSYYYTTQKYFFKFRGIFKHISFKKESRNYIRKNKLNDFYKNENKNNYNVNYINNLEKLNNCCIYENKINFFNNNNYNDIRLTKNYFLGNNLDFLFK